MSAYNLSFWFSFGNNSISKWICLYYLQMYIPWVFSLFNLAAFKSKECQSRLLFVSSLIFVYLNCQAMLLTLHNNLTLSFSFSTFVEWLLHIPQRITLQHLQLFNSNFLQGFFGFQRGQIAGSFFFFYETIFYIKKYASISQNINYTFEICHLKVVLDLQ